MLQVLRGEDSMACRRPAVVESAAAEVTAEGMAPVKEQHSPKLQPQSRPAQKRRRSSMADLTGRLLMDDSVEGLAMLAQPGGAGGLAPPSSPQDSPAGRGGPAGWECWRLVSHLELRRESWCFLPFTVSYALCTSRGGKCSRCAMQDGI